MKIISLHKKMGDSLGRRSAAATLRDEILEYNKPVQLDFSGIKVISYSFAEEFFGKLSEEFGTEIFQTRIQIRNMRPENQSLMRSIVEKRTKLIA